MTGIAFIYPQFLWLLLLIPLTAALTVLGRRALSRARLWGGLALRIFLLLLIILALAGIQVRLPSRTLTAVFVLDASDSIPPEERERGEEMIEAAIEAMPTGDRAAIVVFGEDALVERLASPDSSLARITSAPISTRTDIASALQLATALFPAEGARRLVLLSDGRENLGFALKQAELAAMQDIQLEYIPLGESGQEIEVLVESLEAPADIREGQSFDLNVVVHSSAPVGASLRVFADEQLIHTQELALQAGPNRYSIPIEGPTAGFHRYRAQVTPDADRRLQNNEGAAFTVVHGPPRILVVEGQPGEAENLIPALEAANMQVERVSPAELPTTLPELAAYDAVILANVPASALPNGAMEALPVYVRELGKGLLMTGGENSFGAGGYLRTPIEQAMPVYMDVKSRELNANLALVLAVDKSGSMGRCHCDDPDLNQSYTPIETGQPKVDIAKEAIMRSAGALGPEDYLGVVTFDSQARWALNVQKLVDPLTLEGAIGTFQADGQTNMASGVTAAYEALKGVDAKRKHIILMTDGWVRTGELNALAKEMAAEGITLSVIAAGEGSAEYLEALAQDGQGRYYPAVDMMHVPDIFLKETVQSVGQYIVEEAFFPLPGPLSPALRGVDTNDLPGLFGYNGTSPKGTARLDMLTPRGDPLLASWQYGLGRASAWTSDLKGRWATRWVQWEDFSRFAAQLVGWLVPPEKPEGLTPSVTLQDQGALIQLTAEDPEGRPLNYLDVTAYVTTPNLETLRLPLRQVGAGKYEALAPTGAPGAYLVAISASQDEVPLGPPMTLGLAVPYSPEYRAQGTNLGLLEELARITGGGPLEEPVQAFLHNLPSAESAREVWRPLLLLAALLFPLDVAIRRVLLSPRDLQKARAWARERLSRRGTAARPQERVLGQLFRARERARTRTSGGPAAPPMARPSETASPPQPEPGPPSAPPEPPPSEEDALARLRAAKKRARK